MYVYDRFLLFTFSSAMYGIYIVWCTTPLHPIPVSFARSLTPSFFPSLLSVERPPSRRHRSLCRVQHCLSHMLSLTVSLSHTNTHTHRPSFPLNPVPLARAHSMSVRALYLQGEAAAGPETQMQRTTMELLSLGISLDTSTTSVRLRERTRGRGGGQGRGEGCVGEVARDEKDRVGGRVKKTNVGGSWRGRQARLGL